MSASQAILKAVAKKGDWTTFDEVCSAVLPNSHWRKRGAISARLAQLVDAKKLRRRGEPRAYEYHTTKISLLDLRKVKPNGNPRNSKATARAAATLRPRPSKPTVTAQVVRGAPKPMPHQHITIPPSPAPMTEPPKSALQRETVEQFVARGGHVQRLPNGAVSQPLKHIHAVAKPKTPRRARNPKTDPETD